MMMPSSVFADLGQILATNIKEDERMPLSDDLVVVIERDGLDGSAGAAGLSSTAS
jgi:hypothetical protein